jgi:hypothetical protein
MPMAGQKSEKCKNFEKTLEKIAKYVIIMI